ncbi:uncharacterized protein LOC21404459 isoform X2 [Morus notabilis]|uniref:uncharacterized protein LOC21404459 isoform X2 n=1 Tax=Morus notabilis TaxID=981085 RepID=UPI000CED287A|nr:uncharacterized protein LOC21404459 isoform X2 [Morus notabilis]
MSKKKVSGNTMTLKDFHGGSIPSDLSLPSAPGVIVRPSDRPGYERSAAWGNQMGRADHRSRPHTSPASRHLDDKAPFLTHAAHIGRNFDEDERKPLDGVVAPTRPEPRQESASVGGLWGRQGAAPMSQVNSHSGRVAEASLDTNNGQGVGGAYPNVWVARKEAAGITERPQSPWSAPMAVSKLAHASALEKVSSGRWQSKHSMHQSDAELVRASETESGSQSKDYGNNAYNKIDAIGVVESYDATLAGHGKRVLNVDDYVHGGRKEFPDYERTRAPVNSETSTYVQPSERPKLKLLSRTKPLESVEHTVADHIQGHQKVTESVHTESFNEAHGNLNPPKFGIAHTESEKQAVERPKLKLKPRSQPAEQSEGNVERGRNLLFGGARPRELVLKERGVDDVALNHDLVQHPERVEHHVPRTERISGRPNASRYSERTENPALDQRFGKKSERRDHEMRTENPALDQRSGKKTETKNHRVDDERIDTQRRNWHSENWKNNRDTEKQQQLERAPSPETWRKPVEQPKPTFGKAASAVELAQAFSRSSISEPTNRLSGQRSLPSRAQSQIPFSRLMGGPTPRPQINGY